MGDPDETILAGLDTLEMVADHVGLQGTEADIKTARGALLGQLGMKSDTSTALIATFSESEFNGFIASWEISTAVDANGVSTSARPPSVAERGMARLIGRICRRKMGVEMPASSSTAPSSVAVRKLRLNQVLSQIDEAEFEMLSEADLLVMFARYETLFGKGQRPPSDKEPSSEQLAALSSLLKTHQVPYVDFAIFGPYGTRIKKKLKFSGLVLNKAGELVQSEIFGPSTLSVWKASYAVFRNAMVMLDALDLGPLLQYQARVERMLERYGERTWALLYQAEVRARLEEWPWVRMELKLSHTAALAAGNTTPFDAKRPWNEALRVLADRDKFWAEEFMEPALIVMTDRSALRSLVSDDARAGKGGNEPIDHKLPVEDPSSKVRPRNTNRTGRYHEVAEGKYLKNRTGYGLCSGYQDGSCNDTVQGGWCGRSRDLAHQCSRCLDSHPLHKCPHSEMPSVSWTSRKGKPKGDKGKGRGSKGRPSPY